MHDPRSDNRPDGRAIYRTHYRFQIHGPYADKHYVQSTVLEAAVRTGVNLRQVGSRAYSTNTVESGWIPSPLPGIYTGDGMM